MLGRSALAEDVSFGVGAAEATTIGGGVAGLGGAFSTRFGATITTGTGVDVATAAGCVRTFSTGFSTATGTEGSGTAATTAGAGAAGLGAIF